MLHDDFTGFLLQLFREKSDLLGLGLEPRQNLFLGVPTKNKLKLIIVLEERASESWNRT